MHYQSLDFQVYLDKKISELVATTMRFAKVHRPESIILTIFAPLKMFLRPHLAIIQLNTPDGLSRNRIPNGFTVSE